MEYNKDEIKALIAESLEGAFYTGVNAGIDRSKEAIIFYLKELKRQKAKEINLDAIESFMNGLKAFVNGNKQKV